MIRSYLPVLSLILGLWLLGSKTSAQSVLSVDDCVNEALAHNNSLRKADNEILMATEKRKQVHTMLFPTVSASASTMRANDDLITIDLTRHIGLGWVDKATSANVMAMLPLYTGGQLTNANRLAAVGEEASRLKRQVAADDVRTNVETYYWQTVMLKEKLKTIGIAEQQVENICQDARNAVDAGVRNRNDLLQAQLKQNELRAMRIQVDNSIGVLKDLLGQLMGRTEAFDVADLVHTPDSADASALPASPDALFLNPEVALLQTGEYQLLGKQVEAEQLNYKLTLGKNLPTVAVGGAYVYSYMLNRSKNRLVGLLTVNVPISSWWGGSHDMRRQRLQVENAETSRRDNSELLKIRMRKAWNDVNDAYKQVSIAMESIEQSRENLRLNTDYYEFGTTTMSDLLNAQTLYQQSRDRYVEAYTQYEIKKREYMRATGR